MLQLGLLQGGGVATAPVAGSCFGRAKRVKTPVMRIAIHRVYDSSPTMPGKRVLVDRVWPRGIKKEDLHLDLWMRDVAPSTALRKWFGHDPKRWDEFQRRYRAELKQPAQRAQLDELVTMARKSPVTLLYGARDQEHNQALALSRVVEDSLKK
jgi:uncharacterized protein YeaO (DUF488 family)